jgi:hypothetical protein
MTRDYPNDEQLEKLKKERQELFEETSKRWYERLRLALFQVENRRRTLLDMSEFPKRTQVWIANSPQSRLSLLNLKVWCLRYSVSPEFILDNLLDRFQNVRRLSPTDNTPGYPIKLGLPIGIITGPAARQYIERQVVIEFPNGENEKSLAVPATPPIKIKPYSTHEQMLQDYQEAITKARRQFDLAVQRRSKLYSRNYRKSLREDL